MPMSTVRKRRLCLGSHLPVAGGVSRAVGEARKLGLESLQIFTKNASRWQQKPVDPQEAERFKELREEWGRRPVGSHTSYLINLASPEKALWKKSLAAFVDEIERAETLGLDFLVFHPGSHRGAGARAGIRRVSEALRTVLDRLPDVRTRILLENTAGQGATLGRAFEELREILDLVDAPERLGVCLDTCHLFAAGYELRTPSGYRETMRQLDSVMGAERIFCLHLNDSKGALGSNVDRHEHIGRGHIGTSGFRRVLRDRRFHGKPKILETPKANDMDRVNLKVLENLHEAS